MFDCIFVNSRPGHMHLMRAPLKKIYVLFRLNYILNVLGMFVITHFLIFSLFRINSYRIFSTNKSKRKEKISF